MTEQFAILGITECLKNIVAFVMKVLIQYLMLEPRTDHWWCGTKMFTPL